ncbi:MAG: hypothetical protein ACFFAZ_13845 [Promethearchaeota archaeon]
MRKGDELLVVENPGAHYTSSKGLVTAVDDVSLERCDYCIEICKADVSDYQEVEPRHCVRCHRWSEIEKE